MVKKNLAKFAAAYAILYTAATLLNSILYLANGVYEDPSGNWHELDRAVILLIGMTAFGLCTKLPVKPVIFRYVIAYIPSQLLAFMYVWLCGFRDELASSAYRDVWVNFTIGFLLFCVLNSIITVYKKKKQSKAAAD